MGKNLDNSGITIMSNNNGTSSPLTPRRKQYILNMCTYTQIMHILKTYAKETIGQPGIVYYINLQIWTGP